MDALVRLKASKRRKDKMWVKGYETGESWATDLVDSDEVRTLVEERDTIWCLDTWTGSTLHDWLYDLISPCGYSMGAVSCFWEFVAEEDVQDHRDDPNFLKGFIKGALDGYNEAKGLAVRS